MYKKPYVIAEAGCNHKGSMDTAREFIRTAAKFCGADAIKFQKRCPRELLTDEQYNSPHPDPKNSYGATYGEHREKLEFTLDQHAQLKEWCEEFGITYSASVWDMTSAREIASLKPEFIKIPSACNTNHDMLRWLCRNYAGEIQLSLGMTTLTEEEQIIRLFEEERRIHDLVLFSCTSGYPVVPEDICLLEITRLRERYGDRVKAVGFSGHHLGISADIAAYTLGADMIERHFTLDRAWRGTDHAFSLEPEALRSLVQELEAVYSALSYRYAEILPIEESQRSKMKYSAEKHSAVR